MNCFDCAAFDAIAAAVAICADCGAGVCPQHVHVEPRWLTRTMVINRVVTIEPPARSLICGTCETARKAGGNAAGTARARSLTRIRVDDERLRHGR